MANLYFLRKTPWLNERLASLAMRSAKTVTQDLITDVATKSNSDDLADIDVIILVTSLTVTVGMALKTSPTNCALVGNGVDRVATSAAIARLSAHTLSTKKLLNIVHSVVFSSSGRFGRQRQICSRLFWYPPSLFTICRRRKLSTEVIIVTRRIDKFVSHDDSSYDTPDDLCRYDYA